MSTQKVLNAFRKLSAEQREQFNNFYENIDPEYACQLMVNTGLFEDDDFGVYDAIITLEEDGIVITGAMGCSGYGNLYAVKFNWYGEYVNFDKVANARKALPESTYTTYESMIPKFEIDTFEFTIPSSMKDKLVDTFGSELSELCFYY